MSLVLGLVSLVSFFCVGPFGVVPGVGAIVAAVIGMRSAKRRPGRPQYGIAVAGLVTGVLGTLLAVAIGVFFGWAILSGGLDTGSGGINSDPSDGVCDSTRFLQDPDC